MIRSRFERLARALSMGVLAAMLPWAAAAGQTTTGLIRGHANDVTGAPVGEATVIARSVERDVERTALTNATGFYAIPGLRPGSYEISVRRIGFASQSRSVQLMVGQTLTIDFRLDPAAAQLTGVVVTASPSVETRTSEVATNVSRQQIEELPAIDRNFLSLAALAPGVVLQNDRLDGTRKTMSADAQGANQINVFIDGASYKNDMLQGGVVGQDASRGNPFPRNAVQEFRVITQNFKAEYQKASSAIITATTRTGGDIWEGEAFYNRINESFVALDTFQRRDRGLNPATFRQPEFSRDQYGLSVGGPIGDRIRVFGSFERNDQTRFARVNLPAPVPDSFPAIDTINFAQYNGEFAQPFEANLFFGKATFDQSPTSWFELSVNSRTEDDIRDFGGFTAYTRSTTFNNKVQTATLKHSLVRGSLLNEAFTSWQMYNYNPEPNVSGPSARFFGSYANFECCVAIGSNVSIQDFKQTRLSMRDDLTWTGWQWYGSHVVKGGVNIDFTDYDIEKRNSEIPVFVYEPWFNNFQFPQRVEFQYGDPTFGGNNTQIGLYVQDDWSPTPRLLINAGLRWDYETAMMNYDWVTPQPLVDSLIKYESNLFIPLDRDRYITDGDNRDPFLGAFQPRLGASYALDAAGRTTVYGGWGRFYDRNIYDLAIEEQFAIQHPRYNVQFYPTGGPVEPGKLEWDPRYLTEGLSALVADLAGINALNPEAKLIPNDLKPPMSHQFALGVRQLWRSWVLDLAYNGVLGKNISTFYWADRNFTCPERSFAVPGCFQERPIPGYSVVLMLDDRGRSWYNALSFKADRPYQRIEGFSWGGGVAYTFATRHTSGFNDLFSFPNPVDYPKQRRNDERHRVVMNFITDLPWLWGTQFSSLVTLGSGARYDRGDRFACVPDNPPNPTPCTHNFDPGGGQPGRNSFILPLPDMWSYRRMDIRMRKNFVQIGGNEAAITLDVHNLYNFQNLGCFSATPVQSDPNFGRATCTVSDPRYIQLGIDYRFGVNRAR